MRQVAFYRTREGCSPVEVFLDSLPSKYAQKVIWVLKLVEELDKVPVTYFKKLVATDGIWEVRIQIGNNIFRLMGFQDGDKLIVLTHGFQKKSQKVPGKEIRLAEQRKADYLWRKYE